MKIFLQLIRIKQWIKNLIIFAPIIFALQLFNYDQFIKSFLAFIAFSFVIVIVYIINDIKDKKNDSLHEIKKLRPIASGKIKPVYAIIIGLVFAIPGFFLSFFLGLPSFLIIIIYFILNILYTFILKNLVILDVFIISTGFCLRVLLGSAVIGVHLSHWMLLTTFSGSLIIGFGKRRHELDLLGDDAPNHRNILAEYNKNILDIMIIISTSITAISYTLYTINEDIINKFGTAGLIITVPFVLYGLFRYLLLIYCKGKGGSPEELVINDPGIIIAVLLWFTVILLQIYFKDFINFNFNIIQ
jgi:4-hydroxybenzoate polyprenyltransferase